VAGEPLDQIRASESRPTFRRPLEQMLERDPSLLDEIRRVGKEALGACPGSA
jgi:hypothetical protein